MVKVIENENTVKRVECRECKSLLEYQPSESKTGSHIDYIGDREDFRYIDCPVCCNKVYVK